MRQAKKLNRISLSGLWLTVALLIILILATSVLLGTFISGYVKGDPNVIEVMADSNAMERLYQDQFPAGALPDVVAKDDKVQWETETSVDLFKTAYTGPDGSITVESNDGEKVIAPGTSNHYYFTLKNTGNISLEYTLILEGVFKLADHDIPMFVRLSQDGKWIMGDESSWIHVDEMNDVIENNTLYRGETTVYQFEWMWPYEMEEETDKLVGDIMNTLIAADQWDTELGNVSVGVDTQFVLNIQVTSEIAAEALAEFADGAPVLPRFILTCATGGLMLGSGLWLLILLLLRRNIYFTGLLYNPVYSMVTMDKKESELADGRFIFEKTGLGKHKLIMGEHEMAIRFRYKDKIQGLFIERAEDETIIYMGKKIRAVELYFLYIGQPGIDPLRWAAIDKERYVYTQDGVIAPKDDRNCTPGGLMVDEDGRYGVEERTHAEC